MNQLAPASDRSLDWQSGLVLLIGWIVALAVTLT
jgi:hypothetical protein